MFFDYHLPEHLIAQHPAARRDESRLLVAHRGTGTLEHRVFRDLPELLRPGDLLVLNDTRVLPARLLGVRDKSGGKWEGLYLQTTSEGLWEMMTKTRGHPVSGEVFTVQPGQFRLILRGRTPDHHWLMEPDPPGAAVDLLARFGQMPLPPYIRKGRAEPGDSERYQTVFAEKAGSVAAPTAGLHFTPELIEQLKEKGIETTRVTLHVGLGTFAPVKVDDPAKHIIHQEWCEVTESAVAAIAACKADGGRVVAVGTTAIRTLETAARLPLPGGERAVSGAAASRVRGETQDPSPPTPLPGGERGGIGPFRGETGLYIHPPFEFRVVDVLITNFHLPRTTLLLLVGAFTGGDLLGRAYEEAIRTEYRFYSYGDAMLID